MINPTAAALTFVVIWSSGFIIARGITPYADPNVFLSIRFAICSLIFASLVMFLRLSWPNGRQCLHLLGMGALIQGIYLGAGFWAVAEGMQAGVMSLMGTLQPPLTAAIAGRFFNERMGILGWLGLALGMAGVALAVWPGSNSAQVAVTPVVVMAGLISILGITAGTVLQKTSVSTVHLVTSSAMQNIGAMMTTLLLVLLLGESLFLIQRESLALLAYAVLVLSLGGTTLLLWMVRSGSATRATSLLFLAPPLAAIMAYAFFDDNLSFSQIAGFMLALLGVLLTRRNVH